MPSIAPKKPWCGRNEIARLYELSRALLMDEGRDAVRQSVMQASQILRIGDIAFYDAAANQVYGIDQRVEGDDGRYGARGGDRRAVAATEFP